MDTNADQLKYSWYAGYTDSRKEKKVLKELTQRGIECYLPVRQVRRQWSDRIKTVETVLIPGYIFLKVSPKEFYDVLVNTGVRRYVSFEGLAAPIPEYQILDLKKFMECLNTEVQVTSDRIRKGDALKIVNGPLAGITGEVAEIRGKHNILLRFDNLGFCVYAEVGIDDLVFEKV